MVDDNVELLLTTVDNPYDPFTQFDDWYAFDLAKGYHTPGMLARIVQSSDELSDADQRLAINDAVEEIVRENVLGVWKKVARPVKKTA